MINKLKEIFLELDIDKKRSINIDIFIFHVYSF